MPWSWTDSTGSLTASTRLESGDKSPYSKMGDAAQLDLQELLPRFGLSAFRPGQRDVISTVTSGQDCLCVMPTGGGKSLCYQLPAVACPDVTLVVSPLIALMQDQVQQMEHLGIRATFINSTLDSGTQQQRVELMAAGQFDLVYVAAERFRSPRFREALRKTRVRLLAVDEAHCISEWGHDFRPDYSKLGLARSQLGNPTTIALTATATDSVRRDIIAQLNLREPKVFITGFQRPNLRYEVQQHWTDHDKNRALIDFLRQTPGSGIIYVATRKRCSEVAEVIAREARRSAGIYHAGMLHEDRRSAQDRFMRGQTEIVAATNAFGMGIDKADVRFVVHYNMPGTLEAYYQEAGRAGRDGEPSRCLLLYSSKDEYIQEYFIESAYPDRETVAKVYNFLRGLDQDPIELTQQEIKETLGLPIGVEGVRTSEQLLEKAGVLERLEPSQNMAVVRISSDLPSLVDLLPRQATSQRSVMRVVESFVGDRRHELVYFRPRLLADQTGIDFPAFSRALHELRSLEVFEYVPPFRGRAVHMLDQQREFESLEIDFDTLEKRKAHEYEKLRRVVAFARTNRCRQQQILDYFGQEENPPCETCDNCAAARDDDDAADEPGSDDPVLLQTARIVLSGVARADRIFVDVGFGKNVIAQMLCGSTSAKITKFRMHRLSTHGLLSHLKQTDVTKLIDALVFAGYLEQVEAQRHRPTLKLTHRGEKLMYGHVSLRGGLDLPQELVNKLRQFAGRSAVSADKEPGDSRSAVPADKESGDSGSAVSADKESGDSGSAVPADTDLVVQASRLPTETKTDTPPSSAAETAAPQAHTVSAETADLRTADTPSHYWTWRLLSAGFTPAECSHIRSLDADTIFDHALRAADDGLAIEAQWFLSVEKLATFEKVIGPEEPARIRPLLSRLPKGTRYEEVQLFLRCRAFQPSRPVTP